MERWNILYFDKTKNEWHRPYFYTLKEFSTALERIKADETKTDVSDNYEKFSAETKPFCDLYV